MHKPTTQPWEDMPLPITLCLASQSPRRLALLRTIGIQAQVFAALPATAAEALETPKPQEDPLTYVQRIAQLKLHTALKALQTQSQNYSGWVLAADTTVALNNTLLGKPSDTQAAQAMLQALSNATHTVHTAVAIAHVSQQHTALGHTHHTAKVSMAYLPIDFIQNYIASGEPFDKAGAYGIQGSMAQYVRHIEGSHSSIVGLPLFETACLLKQMQYALTITPKKAP
jgi:septum formation protein